MSAVGAMLLTMAALGSPAEAIEPPKTDGSYFWIDGSYRSISLPRVDLGVRMTTPPGQIGPGTAVAVFNPRLTGLGVDLTLGYVFPNGTFPAMFGARTRVEVGFSHVTAAGTEAMVNRFGRGSSIMLDADVVNPFKFLAAACLPACLSTTTTLASDYRAWQGSIKVAGDFPLGAIVVTPSLAIFGGTARNEQRFFQVFNIPVVGDDLYAITSSVRWRDAGIRTGLDLRLALSSWLILGLDGAIGIAARHATMSADDFAFATLIATHAEARAHVAPLLAKLEANVTVAPAGNVWIRAFVGLNHDSKVPGITAPFYVGPLAAPTSIMPASIGFFAQTSYYAGGRAGVSF